MEDKGDEHYREWHEYLEDLQNELQSGAAGNGILFPEEMTGSTGIGNSEI
jgi:hypothetical protein